MHLPGRIGCRDGVGGALVEAERQQYLVYHMHHAGPARGNVGLQNIGAVADALKAGRAGHLDAQRVNLVDGARGRKGSPRAQRATGPQPLDNCGQRGGHARECEVSISFGKVCLLSLSLRGAVAIVDAQEV